MNTSTLVFLGCAGFISVVALYLTVARCYSTGFVGAIGFLLITLGFGSMIMEALDGTQFEVLPQTTVGMIGLVFFFLQHLARVHRQKSGPTKEQSSKTPARTKKILSQGGFLTGGYMLLVQGLALVVVITGVYFYIDRHWETTAGIARGVEKTEARWAAANEEAEKEAAKKKRAAEALAEELAHQLIEAESNAKDYEQKYAAERAARKRASVPLGFVDCGKTQLTGGAENESQKTGTDVTLTLRLSWSFVRDYDAAWTSETGQPVFSIHPGGVASGEQASAASPLKLDDVLDNHAVNAALCSTDRRRLNALVGKITKLKGQYQP